MDKDNKYYGIIENLVKNHRKFPGLEAIVEDIIDDVYTHSRSIIESINDDSVIDGYLNKVVATSIITVPKRLNFHNELVHRPISACPELPKPFVPPVEETKPTKVERNEEIKQVLNNAAESDNEEPLQEEIFIDDNELENAAVDDVVTEDDDINIDFSLETEPENAFVQEVEEVSETIESEVEKPNNDLVDKMINSIAEDTLKENELSEEDVEEFEEEIETETDAETDIDNDDNSLGDSDFEDLLEEPLLENNFTEESVNYHDVSSIEDLTDLQVEEPIEVDESQTLDLIDNDIDETSEVDTLTEDTTDTNEIFSENDNIFSDDEEDESETDLQEDTLENDISNENTDVLELSEPEFEDEQVEIAEENVSLLTEEDDDIFENTNDETVLTEDTDLQEIDSDNSLSFSDDESENLLEPDFDMTLDSDDSNSDLMIEEEEEEKEEVEEQNFSPVNYSVFGYTPKENEEFSDSGEIVAKLLDINNQEPELNILKIFDLKYKQNLTIEEIMAELNLEKQEVITALDKMVDLI